MSSLTPLLTEPVARLGATTITLGQALGSSALLLLLLVLTLIVALRRSVGMRAMAVRQARDTQARMDDILGAQAEMKGRLGTMADIFNSRQAELAQAINQRLDCMTGRIGQTMADQTRSTYENLARLQERLVAIDTAQNNIQSLAGQMVQLQSILSDKQTRGAFGQSRMEAIISDGLPFGTYEFQATLSNGKRPDCLIKMPNNAPAIAIDAKFPLESWNEFRKSGSPDARASAAQSFRRDVQIHIRNIAEKYLLAGETQDTALMFVPSESIFAEIHESFEAVVQRALRSRVVMVSPSLLMLSIQLIQSLLKDASMREQAHRIQIEVASLMEDAARLDERVRKLQQHFSQTSRDVDDILISSSRLARRGQKIKALECGGSPEEKESVPDAGQKEISPNFPESCDPARKFAS